MPPVPFTHLDVTTPIGDPPLRRFVGRIDLALDTGAAGDRPRIDPITSRFHATLHAHDYDALASGAPAATVSGPTVVDGKRRVVVTLDAPRRVLRLSSTGSAGPSLALYRVDGDTFAVEPTVTTGGPSTTHAYVVGGEFVDGRFGVEGGTGLVLDEVDVRSRPAGVALSVVSASLSDPAAAAAVPAWRSPEPSPGGIDLDTTFGTAVQAVVDGQPLPLPSPLVLSVVLTADAPLHAVVHQAGAPHVLVDTGFAPFPLVPSDVAEPDALADALRVPRRPLDDFLRDLLDDDTRRLVDRPGAPRPALVARVLAALSNALVVTPMWDPNRFAGLAVPVGLATAAADGPTGERLVRVNRALLELALPDVLQARDVDRILDLADRPTVVVRRPPGGTVVAATLRVEEEPDVGGVVADTAREGDTVEQVGAEVRTDGWVATVVQPATAISVDAVEVRLLGAGPGVEVRLEVREDHQGLPAGRALAAGVAAAPPGRTDWVRVVLDGRIVLGTTNHWVALRAGVGRAVWLTGPDGPCRWARRDGDGAWSEWSADGRAARLRLGTDVAVAGRASSLAVVAGGNELPVDPVDRANRDLSGAFGPGSVGTAAVVVVDLEGTGTARLAPPVVVYEPE